MACRRDDWFVLAGSRELLPLRPTAATTWHPLILLFPPKYPFLLKITFTRPIIMSDNYSDVNLYVDFAGFAVASLLIKLTSNAFVYYWVHFGSDKMIDNRFIRVMTLQLQSAVLRRL